MRVDYLSLHLHRLELHEGVVTEEVEGRVGQCSLSGEGVGHRQEVEAADREVCPVVRPHSHDPLLLAEHSLALLPQVDHRVHQVLVTCPRR